MTNQSSDFLKGKGIVAKVNFDDKEAHRLTFKSGTLEDVDFGQGSQKVMVYMMTEDGEERKVTSTSVALAEKLATAEDGDVFDITKIRKSNGSGGYITTYTVAAIYDEEDDGKDIGTPEFTG